MDRRKPRHNKKDDLASAQSPATRANYILAHGERLTKPVSIPRGAGEKVHPYSFAEAKDRLRPQIKKVVETVFALPADTCPNDETVIGLTLHPSYLAKSYFPVNLLRALNLRVVGSQRKMISPEKTVGKKTSGEVPTVELFVAGQRSAIQRLAERQDKWNPRSTEAQDLIRIERIQPIKPEDKFVPFDSKEEVPLLEIVLHASKNAESRYIVEGFFKFLSGLGIEAKYSEKKLFVGGLCFIPLRAPQSLIPKIISYSFLRVLRKMPSLRSFLPLLRMATKTEPFPFDSPEGGPINPDIHTVVMDGGIPSNANLSRWVHYEKAPGVTEEDEDGLKHGLTVTSAVLFGPLQKDAPVSFPFSRLDHYCVLGKNDQGDFIYDVLARVISVLESKRYEFANLSLGPRLPIEDNHVDPWTSVIDQVLSDGKIFLTVAVGNDGDKDRPSGNARIQIPADCVNAVSVGAADSLSRIWRRAPYSSIGPGRTPGYFKPDVVAFGGADAEPFWVIDPQNPASTFPAGGTSYSSPAALRIALGLRSQYGGDLKPLVLKALLVHHSDSLGHDKIEVGWGRIPASLDAYMKCPPGTIKILYQGELPPKKYLRIPVPLPKETLKGNVTIKATLCYATETDPEHPFHYSRSGLEVTFRPHSKVRSRPEQEQPKTTSFFRPDDQYMTESALRRSAFKWESTLHGQKRMRGASLDDPVFDVHYMARTGGRPAKDPKPIAYAFVLTVEAPNHPDLYDNVVVRYRTQLEALRPVVEIPIQSQGM